MTDVGSDVVPWLSSSPCHHSSLRARAMPSERCRCIAEKRRVERGALPVMSEPPQVRQALGLPLLHLRTRLVEQPLGDRELQTPDTHRRSGCKPPSSETLASSSISGGFRCRTWRALSRVSWMICMHSATVSRSGNPSSGANPEARAHAQDARERAFREPDARPGSPRRSGRPRPGSRVMRFEMDAVVDQLSFGREPETSDPVPGLGWIP